jgi:hypothetical protein
MGSGLIIYYTTISKRMPDFNPFIPRLLIQKNQKMIPGMGMGKRVWESKRNMGVWEYGGMGVANNSQLSTVYCQLKWRLTNFSM